MKTTYYLLLAAAVFSMGMSGPLIRLAEAPALAIVAWRAAMAWPFLAAMSLVKREVWPWKLAIPAGFSLALHWIAWVIAVQTTTIANASVLICTGALWSTLLSRPLLKERIRMNQWFGLLLALLGVILIVTVRSQGRHTVGGDVMALLGSFAWVAYAFIGRRARQQSEFWGYASAVYLSAIAVILIVTWTTQVSLFSLSSRGWIYVTAMAIFPTLIGHGTLNFLLRFLGPAKLSLWGLLEPVLASLVAWPVFNEIPPIQVLSGGVITILGVALGVRGNAPSKG